MKCQHITDAKHFFQRTIGSVFLRFLILIRVVTDHFTPKAGQIPHDMRSDLSGSDNPDGEIFYLFSNASGQRIVHTFRPLDDGFHLADRHQNQHHRIVCHTSGRICHVADRYSVFLCRFQIHMIVADGSGGNMFYPRLAPDLYNILRDRRRDHTDPFTILRKNRILYSRSVMDRNDLHLILSGKFLKKCRLIKISVIICCYLHNLPSLHIISMYFFAKMCVCAGTTTRYRILYSDI